MGITYSTDRDIPADKLIALYAAADYNAWWTERNVRAMLDHIHTIVTAWAGDQLVGTVGVVSDERQGLRTLEPFCGTGRIVIPLATDCHEVVGLDQAKAMLDRARTKTPDLPDWVQRRTSPSRCDVRRAA